MLQRKDVDRSMPQKLLLIEDSFTIQRVVETTFVPEDFQVVVAHDAHEGLDKLRAVLPDIVLADATLPDMDGFELCQMIRETQGCEHIPVLLLTSHFASYDEAYGQRVGVTGYLAKPFESHTLFDVVQQFMARPPTHTMAAQIITAPSDAISPLEPSESLPCAWETSKEEEGATMSQDMPRDVGPTPPVAEAPVTPSTRSSAATAASTLLHQSLGQSVLRMVQEALQTQLATMLNTLTPHILEEVQKTVSAKIPELLEVLLQQEIEKLRRAVAQEYDDTAPERDAEQTAE